MGGNAVLVMVGDGCEGVPAVVENCEFAVLVIVDDSAFVELSVVDSGEVALGVKVDEDCVVWPSVVDLDRKCRSDNCCGRDSVLFGYMWLTRVKLVVDVMVDGYCDI